MLRGQDRRRVRPERGVAPPARPQRRQMRRTPRIPACASCFPVRLAPWWASFTRKPVCRDKSNVPPAGVSRYFNQTSIGQRTSIRTPLNAVIMMEPGARGGCRTRAVRAR